MERASDDGRRSDPPVMRVARKCDRLLPGAVYVSWDYFNRRLGHAQLDQDRPVDIAIARHMDPETVEFLQILVSLFPDEHNSAAPMLLEEIGPLKRAVGEASFQHDNFINLLEVRLLENEPMAKGRQNRAAGQQDNEEKDRSQAACEQRKA